MSRTDPHRTALVTLGRLPVALEVVRALAAGGWRVLVADPLGVHLCRCSRRMAGHRAVRAPADDPDGYLEDLARIVERDGVSLVVPVSEEAPHVARLAGRTRAAVLGPAHATLLELHDKLAFARLAQRIGVAVPESAPADEAAALCAAHDWIEKPRLSCSGVGVTFGARGAAASGRADRVVQRRIAGAERSSFAFARDGRVLASVVYRGLLTAGSVSVQFEAVETPAGIDAAIATLVRATGCTGMLGMDFLEDPDGRWLAIECNPRATSGVHLFEADAVRDALSAMIGDAAPPIEPVGPGTRRQEFWSSLLEIERALVRGRLDRDGWRRLFSTRDVTWRRDDPLPFPLMTLASLPLLCRALRARRPITEVATTDVGWYRHGA